MIGLKLEGITRRFREPQEHLVLNGIDLAIEPGEFVALVGPSGAGKTTLLRVIAGLDHGFEGHVAWSGAGTPRLGMVFQEPRLVPWLSIIDNLLLITDESARAEAIALLDQVELAGSENALPTQLSGGMQRRAALARALLAKPDLLLLDEPLISLDRARAARLRSRLVDYWHAHRPTILMVTHDLEEAVEVSSRIVALAPDSGGLVADRRISLPYPRLPGDPAIATLVDELRDLAPPQAPAPAAEEGPLTKGAQPHRAYFSGTGAFNSVG